jgi:hypothetical protein
MAESKATTLLENEQADRFPSARASGSLIWTREQGKQLREIQNEQSGPPTPEEIAAEANEQTIEDKFNT